MNGGWEGPTKGWKERRMKGGREVEKDDGRDESEEGGSAKE